VKLFRVGIRLDRHRVTIMHGAHVTLVDAGENHTLPRLEIVKTCVAPAGSPARVKPAFPRPRRRWGQAPNFLHCGVLRQAIGMFDSDDFQSLFCGLQVSLSLVLCRFRLFEVGLGNDAMLVQVLRPRVAPLRQAKASLALR